MVPSWLLWQKKYFGALFSWRFLHFSEPEKCDSYATVLSCFSWTMSRWLSDDCQMSVCQRLSDCLSDIPPIICQPPPDTCQTSTTYTPNMYHMPTRHILYIYHMYTRCPPDKYQTSTRYLSDIWYMSGVYVGHVSQMSAGASGRHLTIIWPGAPYKYQLSGGIGGV